MLFRHGKSDWDAGFGADAERPLATRGINAAERMGRFVAESGAIPELALTSPAVRARTTLELAAAAGGWDCEIEVERSIYGGSYRTVLDVIHRFSDDHRRVLITGHEPTWSTLTSQLTGGSHFRFPTAAIACIGLPGDWAEAAPDTGELQWFVTPKVLQ